jgi:hypothetical protein
VNSFLLAALASPLQQPSLLERRFRGQFSIAAVTGAVWRELDLYASRENGAIVILSEKREESRGFLLVARQRGDSSPAEAGSE